MTPKRLAKRPLAIPDILSRADAYREATGHWEPTGTSLNSYRN